VERTKENDEDENDAPDREDEKIFAAFGKSLNYGEIAVAPAGG